MINRHIKTVHRIPWKNVDQLNLLSPLITPSEQSIPASPPPVSQWSKTLGNRSPVFKDVNRERDCPWLSKPVTRPFIMYSFWSHPVSRCAPGELGHKITNMPHNPKQSLTHYLTVSCAAGLTKKSLCVSFSLTLDWIILNTRMHCYFLWSLFSSRCSAVTYFSYLKSYSCTVFYMQKAD